jgi:hypothetical protein
MKRRKFFRDIFEVKRRMKEKDYYPGYLDDIYSDGMKWYVMKFRKYNGPYGNLGIGLVDYK